MRKLVFVLLFLPVFSIAQNCKYERNDIDKFTKQKVIITESVIMWKNPMGGNSLSFKSKNIDDIYLLEMRYSMSNVFAIEKDSKLYFLTTNDENIEVLAIESKVSDSYSTTSFCIVNYAISEEIRVKLSIEQIKSIRFYTTDGYIEHDIRSKKQTILNNIMNCIK